jgi:hypothetical protein
LRTSTSPFRILAARRYMYSIDPHVISNVCV